MDTYIIYCDESTSKGKYFSNFYGGALLDARDYDRISNALNSKKIELNLFNEIKWTKVTKQYLEKYIEFIDYYFSFISSGDIKIRIMFRKNEFQAQNLNEYQELNSFYLLYYQFIKNAFGLKYCNQGNDNVRLITYFDKLPNTREQNELFKKYIYDLQDVNILKDAHIVIDKDDITDVDSKKHVILQGMDIILGSIQFRLNKDHLRKDPVTGKRGDKTKAKEILYNRIFHNIRNIHPNFNIGISTGKHGDDRNFWLDPYRHWSFIPSSYSGVRYEEW